MLVMLHERRTAVTREELRSGGGRVLNHRDVRLSYKPVTLNYAGDTCNAGDLVICPPVVT